MITILAAIGPYGEIGKDNTLLWKIPEDMKFFKEYTTGKTVIMGRKTYESIGRPLPNRKNIVISSQPVAGMVSCATLEVALSLTKDDPEVVIIGGGQLYRAAMDKADVMLITHVHKVFASEADVFFPQINISDWVVESIVPSKDENYNYSFVKYNRKKILDK